MSFISHCVALIIQIISQPYTGAFSRSKHFAIMEKKKLITSLPKNSFKSAGNIFVVSEIFSTRERESRSEIRFPSYDTRKREHERTEGRKKRSGARTLCVNFPPTRTTTTTTPKKALTWRAQQAARVHGGKEEKSGLDRRIPLAESGGIDRSFVSRPIEFQPKLARFAAQQRFVIEISANLRIILDRGF